MISFGFSEERDSRAITKEVAAYVQKHVVNGKQVELFFNLVHFDFSKIDLKTKVFSHVVDFGPSAHLFFLAADSLFLFILLYFFAQPKAADGVPRGFSNLVELMVSFVYKDICVAQMGEEEGERLAPFFLTLFVLILVANYIGVVPGMSTPTSNINFTAALALMIFILMPFLGIRHQGFWGFLKSFFPQNLPWYLGMTIGPFIYATEFLGMFIRSFALCIRLFANMLAGHMMILSVAGLIVAYGLKGISALVLLLIIYALKILICFLQAYIFVLLSAIFLSLCMHPHE